MTGTCSTLTTLHFKVLYRHQFRLGEKVRLVASGWTQGIETMPRREAGRQPSGSWPRFYFMSFTSCLPLVESGSGSSLNEHGVTGKDRSYGGC